MPAVAHFVSVVVLILALHAGSAAQTPIDPLGTWRHAPQATWTIIAAPDGRYHAQETGLGNASGPAYWTPAGTFRIDYTTRGGGVTGYYEMRFAPDGRSATGTVRELTGPKRTGASTWTRISGPPASAAAPDLAAQLAGTWSWVSGQQLVIAETGTCRVLQNGREINTCRWEVLDAARRVIRITHRQGGWVDTVTLSADGRSLDGRNNVNAPIHGEKAGGLESLLDALGPEWRVHEYSKPEWDWTGTWTREGATRTYRASYTNAGTNKMKTAEFRLAAESFVNGVLRFRRADTGWVVEIPIAPGQRTASGTMSHCPYQGCGLDLEFAGGRGSATPAAGSAARGAAASASQQQGETGGRATGDARPPGVVAGGTAAQGPEQRSGPAAGDDHPWARGTVAPLNIRAQLPPLPLRPALDIRKLSVAQYNGAVSAAMEGLRLLQEPMTAEERKKFEAKWAPLFNFPTTAAVEYFNALTPLLDEVLMLRGVIVQASHAVDEAWLDAKYAAGYESEAGTRAAMAIVAQQTSLLQMAQARLAPAVEKIRALGNPPSPLAAQAAARTQHQEAAKAAEQVLPGITIAPAGLEGAPGTAYTFTPSGRNLPGNVTLGWTFGDGGKASGGMTAARHAFATEGTYTVQVVAYDGGKRPVAKASVPVTIQSKAGSAAAPAAAGEWVLTRIEREDRKATGPTGHPSYDSSEHGDASFGATAHPGIFDFAASWRVPPQRVKPGETVQIPWRFSSGGSGAGSTAGGTLEIGATGETYDPSRLDQQNWHYTGRGAAQSGTYRWKFPAGTPGATMRITVRASAQEINEFASLVRSFVYTFGGAPAASQEAAPAAGAASRAEDEAKRQAIAEHEHNIRAIERFVARDQEELAREADSRRRADLEARIRSAQADIQAEKDLIASLQTGQIVHTRTEWDEHAHGQFVRNIHGQQQVLGAVLKILDRSERLIGILPPHEAARVREFAHRQLSSEVVARMDLTQARKVMDVIGRQVQAYYDGQSARQEEKAAWANYGLEAAQNIKSAADTGMMITSAFGGQSLNLLYQAGTGYVEGGPLEAVKKAATTYSDAIDYAVTAYDGYKKGGLSGAGQDLAFKYVQSKALAWVTGKLGGGQADANRHRPSVQEQFEAARFKQEREWGEALVKDFQRAQAEIQSAGRRGAPPETIMRLQAVARDKAAAVASSLHAKNYLKYKADVHAGKAYDAHMRAIHADVDARVKQQMRDQGWNADEWELKEFRNASSYGKPNMDRDVGLRETPLWEVDANGQPRLDANKRPIPNPERWETRNGKLILKPQVVKNGKAATLHQWQAEAAEAYARAYRQATGRSAAMAMEGVTTSAHPEAYKDLKWLGGDQIPDAGWAGQAADVTRYKLGAPGHADPAASYFTKMQEVARGTSKDMETKLLPLLEKARPKGAGSSSAEADEALRHWRKINAVLSAFGKNEIDPIYAHRRIRELTGGKSLAEVVDQMGTMMEAAVKFGQ